MKTFLCIENPPYGLPLDLISIWPRPTWVGSLALGTKSIFGMIVGAFSDFSQKLLSFPHLFVINFLPHLHIFGIMVVRPFLTSSFLGFLGCMSLLSTFVSPTQFPISSSLFCHRQFLPTNPSFFGGSSIGKFQLMIIWGEEVALWFKFSLSVANMMKTQNTFFFLAILLREFRGNYNLR